jgi:hypothetical protein
VQSLDSLFSVRDNALVLPPTMNSYRMIMVKMRQKHG